MTAAHAKTQWRKLIKKYLSEMEALRVTDGRAGKRGGKREGEDHPLKNTHREREANNNTLDFHFPFGGIAKVARNEYLYK